MRTRLVARLMWGVVMGGLLAACGPSLTVRTDYDRALDFSRYRTFRMGETRQIMNGNGNGKAPVNTLVKDRIDNALQAQLAAEGLAPAGEDADLEVRYVAGARTRQELESSGFVYPYWGGMYTDDFWIREYPEGTLVIDLVDATTNKLVWRAYVQAEGEGFRSAEFIQKAVARAFEKYPPRA